MSQNPRFRFYADIMALHPEVTGSCHLVVVKFPDGRTTKFMVDFGLFQEEEHRVNNQKMLCHADELAFVLVTHNHVDHIGRLPFLVKHGFNKSIYMTTGTKGLIVPALEDSCHVLRDIAKRQNTKELYTVDDLEKAKPLFVGVDFFKEIKCTPEITATFFPNGHLFGAAIIYVKIMYEGCEDINIFFTGDYNNKNMFFEVAELPEKILNLPMTVVQESTYGHMNSTDIKPVFENNILNAIADQKTVIVPVFSLGRTQEILYVLKKLQQEDKLSTSIPIYLDGKLAIRYTSILRASTDYIDKDKEDFLPDNLTILSTDTRNEIINSTKIKIIVSTSGMGTYGPVQLYIAEYLQRSNALIHFTGYTAEGTLGAKLKAPEKGNVIETFGLFLVKRADVEYTTEYSAHAKADEMITFLKKFKNLKMVLLNHGQIEIKETFANRILREINPKNLGILGNGYLFRVNHYGLVKTMGTKFE